MATPDDENGSQPDGCRSRRPESGVRSDGSWHALGADPDWPTIMTLNAPHHPTPPTVSVIVCADRRRPWQELQAAVESARAQADTSQVVVVIDHAPELLARAIDRWPTLTVVENSEAPGLPGSRNTGILVAESALVAFLDSGATADADWLTWLLDAFDDPTVAVAGGHVEPVWHDASGPARHPDELLWIVGCSYAGLPTDATDVSSVLESSMVFRRAAVLAAGGFSGFTSIVGRVGAVTPGSDATELCIRIRQADPVARICYELLSLVHRRIPAGGGTWRHLARRAVSEGVTKAALSRSLGRSDSLETESAYLVGVVPKAFVRELRRLGRGGGTRALALVVAVSLTLVGYALGVLSGARVAEPAALSSGDSGPLPSRPQGRRSRHVGVARP